MKFFSISTVLAFLPAMLIIDVRINHTKPQRIQYEIGKIIVDTAVALHRELGPGLLETVYKVILAHEVVYKSNGK